MASSRSLMLLFSGSNVSDQTRRGLQIIWTSETVHLFFESKQNGSCPVLIGPVCSGLRAYCFRFHCLKIAKYSIHSPPRRAAALCPHYDRPVHSGGMAGLSNLSIASRCSTSGRQVLAIISSICSIRDAGAGCVASNSGVRLESAESILRQSLMASFGS